MTLVVFLTGCTFLNKEQVVSWQTYKNSDLGFSIKVPEKVLTDYTDEYSLTDLNIFEDKGVVYFTAHSFEETLKNDLSEFMVIGTTIKDQNDILPFYEATYGVAGCKIEFSKDESSGFFYLAIFAKDDSLPVDDPLACAVSGKVRTVYDSVSGKLITYHVNQPFFYEPGGAVGEEALESFEFLP